MSSLSNLFLFPIAAGFFIVGGRLVGKGKAPNYRQIRNAGIFGAGGAATVFLVDHLLNQFEFDQQTADQLHHMNFAELHQFVSDQNLLNETEMNNLHQQMAEQDLLNQMQVDRMMSDPYITTGIDHVVDEMFHGIDHGYGIANSNVFHDTFQDDSFHDNSFHDFGGGGEMGL